MGKRKKAEEAAAAEAQAAAIAADTRGVVARLTDAEGNAAGPPQLEIPQNVTPAQLTALVNNLLKAGENPVPYGFWVDGVELEGPNLGTHLLTHGVSVEKTLELVYRPQAAFHVRAVTRCSATVPGHTEAVLSVAFSSDGRHLASGSGDTTVRLWDANAGAPRKTLAGHSNWVLVVCWSPDGALVASGSMDKTVRLWSCEGHAQGVLKGHKGYVTSLAWEPAHRCWPSRRLASASRDGSARVWDANSKKCAFSLHGHTAAITCVKWGGEGRLYTSSRDRTIGVWDAGDGRMLAQLKGHAHWVNTIALSTEGAIRLGACGPRGEPPADRGDAAACTAAAAERYRQLRGADPERLASGSDDYTMHLWEPMAKERPVARMTGHQQLINHVAFSPDGLKVASASFDRSVRLWDAASGAFLAALRGHVSAVYVLAWSADSRLVVSGSKDSTLKVWDVSSKKLREDLPGHADEVFAVDWSPDGRGVASGGKDRVLKLWRH